MRLLSVLSAVLGWGISTCVQAVTILPVTFDPTGTAGAAGDQSNTATLGISPGNALAIRGNEAGRNVHGVHRAVSAESHEGLRKRNTSTQVTNRP